MWIKIRTFGELQILTKASYFMMLFVPILAGVWPAVRVGINKYNSAITESKLALDSASQRLEFIVLSAEDNNVSASMNEVLDLLNSNVNLILNDYSFQVIDKVGLPSVWAFAFLGSLLVTLGHLVYQATAPNLIREYAHRDYMATEVKRFLESGSEAQLSRAIYHINNYEKKVISRSMSPIKNLPIGTRSKGEEVSHIEGGAGCEYMNAANSKLLYANISGVFYITGLSFIIWVVISQTLSVITATWG